MADILAVASWAAFVALMFVCALPIVVEVFREEF